MRLLVCAVGVAAAMSGCLSVADDRPAPRPVVIDPVCGEAVDQSTPWRGRFRNNVYYFHSDGCRERFFSDPEYYAYGPYPERRSRVYRDQVYYADPVCGRDVPSTRWRYDYGGRTYYFHDAECRREFQFHPQAYVGTYRRGTRGYEAR